MHNPKTTISDGMKAIDWFGSISVIGLTVMLLLGLNFGGATFPWDSPKVICLIVFGCLMSVLFIFSERKLAKYPLMPLGLLKDRSNVMALITNMVHGFVSLCGQLGAFQLLIQDRCSSPASTTCRSISNPSKKPLQSAPVF